jgi:hypothetical protein
VGRTNQGDLVFLVGREIGPCRGALAVEVAMSRNNEHSHKSRRLHRAVSLGLSGAALAGMIYFEGIPARAEADEADVAIEFEDVAIDEVPGDTIPEASPIALPPTEPEPVASPADGRLAMATVVDTAAATPVLPLGPALVAVPDIAGMGLRKARKELAAVGLKLAVRDEYGDKLPAEDWSEYKVGTQRVEAGTEVVPGSTVKVKAKMLRRYAMGY